MPDRHDDVDGGRELDRRQQPRQHRRLADDDRLRGRRLRDDQRCRLAGPRRHVEHPHLYLHGRDRRHAASFQSFDRDYVFDPGAHSVTGEPLGVGNHDLIGHFAEDATERVNLS